MEDAAGCMGACLMAAEFAKLFGRCPELAPPPAVAAALGGGAEPWAALAAPPTLAALVEAPAPPDVLVAFVCALLAVAAPQLGPAAAPLAPPDALNWQGCLRRLLERDVVERERRALRERVDENYLPEEVPDRPPAQPTPAAPPLLASAGQADRLAAGERLRLVRAIRRLGVDGSRI
jgi:hypothetical protein